MQKNIENFLKYELILYRFSTFEGLENTINNEIKTYNLKIKNYSFKDYYDNDFEDYQISMCIGNEYEDVIDLTIYYAITRIGERVILESFYEEV